MKAKVTSVSKNGNNLFAPQIDIDVLFTEGEFERNYIFTLPHEEFVKLDEAELEKKVKQIGEYFKDTIKKNDDMTTKEDTLKSFVNTEFDI